LGCRRQIRRFSNTSCRKSFLKLRSDLAGCRFPPKLWANPPGGLCTARQQGPRCACRPSHWPWPPALAQGCSCLPFLPGLGYHTSRPQRCDRLGAAERREQKTPLHSLSLEVSMAAARSKVGRLQPGFPRIALASCPACAAHRLTDHCPCADNVWHFSDSRSFLLQWGGGLLACARRAAGLQLS
jgi:hypothetical protein